MTRSGFSARLPLAVLGAVALAVLVAAPAAAVQPTRTRISASGDRVRHFPAGEGCTFDVTVYLTTKAHASIIEFVDGREVVQEHSMKREITSDVTHKSFVENQEYRDVEWIDPTTGLRLGETTGQFIDQFYPGDMTPYGVTDHVVAYSIVGSQTYALDPTSYATLAVTVEGTITDICAAIS